MTTFQTNLLNKFKMKKMKTKILVTVLSIIISAGLHTVSAQHEGHGGMGGMSGMSPTTSAKISSFEDFMKVKGNCDLCKKRIETAAVLVPGVQNAEWDKKTKNLKVTYTDVPKRKDVQEAVLKTGHDFEIAQATDEAYNELPECCKYRVKK